MIYRGCPWFRVIGSAWSFISSLIRLLRKKWEQWKVRVSECIWSKLFFSASKIMSFLPDVVLQPQNRKFISDTIYWPSKIPSGPDFLANEFKGNDTLLNSHFRIPCQLDALDVFSFFFFSQLLAPSHDIVSSHSFLEKCGLGAGEWGCTAMLHLSQWPYGPVPMPMYFFFPHKSLLGC